MTVDNNKKIVNKANSTLFIIELVDLGNYEEFHAKSDHYNFVVILIIKKNYIVYIVVNTLHVVKMCEPL